MKIVNKEEFYNLPKGAVYSDYEPCVFSGLYIKQGNIHSRTEPIDFVYKDLIGNIDSDDTNHFVGILDDALINKSSLPLHFNSMERDGLFDSNQLFAVYEKEDLEELIKELKNSLTLMENNGK